MRLRRCVGRPRRRVCLSAHRRFSGSGGVAPFSGRFLVVTRVPLYPCYTVLALPLVWGGRVVVGQRLALSLR